MITYFTAGLASGFVAGSAGATGMTAATSVWATATASAGAGWANAAATAMITSAASGAAISTINSRGNLATVLRDITSTDAVKGYAVSGITAGLTAGVYDKWTGTQTAGSTLPNSAAGAGSTLLANSGKVASGSLATWSGVGQFAANQALQNVTSATVSNLLGMGGSFGDALRTSLANTFAAAGFNYVGTTGYINNLAPGSPEMIGLHALMGGLAAVAAGGDFKAGALAGGASEALVKTLDGQFAGLSPEKRSGLLVMTSQLVGVAAAATVDTGDGRALQTGAWVAQNGTQYNYLSDHQKQLRDKEYEGCKPGADCLAVFAKWSAIDLQQDIGLTVGVGGGMALSAKETAEGIVSLFDNWDETEKTFKQLFSSPEFRAKAGDAYLTDLQQRMDFLTQAYNDAGWDGSVTAGVEAGKIASELVGLLTVAKGVVGVTVKLPAAAGRLVDAASDALAAGKGGPKVIIPERAPLPEGYLEGSKVGAAFNETGNLPEGFRRVINSKTGNTEVLGADGTLYYETSDGLKTKAGGNLRQLVAAEQAIADAKELGRVDPPIPKVDVTNDFMMNVFKDGGVQLKYGDPDGVAGLVVNVDKAGVLGFEIRAAQNHPYYDASGTDMFASAMQRLGNEGIKVNQIRGAWEAGTDSVNTARYLENIANGMSKENAALNTWTGQIAQKYGYGKVEKIETIGGINYVTFRK